jgi:hypothetical protein
MLGLQQQAYRLRYDLESMRAQLNALRIWIGQNRDLIPPKAREEYNERIEKHEGEVEEFEKLHQSLQKRISHEKNLISITSEEEAREDEIRAQYAATLDKEREILGSAKQLEGERAAIRRGIESQRGVVATYRAELERFERRLARLVQHKAQDLKAEVLKERAILDGRRRAIEDARQEAKQVIGEVAQGSLDDVQREFQNIVLRADVGIVDVAWALKETQTHEISRTVNEQRRELQVLDEEFGEVLQEN